MLKRDENRLSKLDVHVTLSVMHPASNEMPSEMLQKTTASPDYETGSGHVG